MLSTRFIAALAVSVLVGCGGKSFEVDPNDGGSDQGGSNQSGSNQGGSNPKAGSSQGGSVDKGGAPPGGSGQGGSAGSVCESFNDDPGTHIAIEIHNQTQAPLHLGDEVAGCGTGGRSTFIVDDAGGNSLPMPGFCRQPCQTVRDGAPLGCPAICYQNQTLTLQPGEIYYTSWDGLFLTQKALPHQCLANPEYGGTCDQAQAIQPGAFTFASRAGRELQCAPGDFSTVCQACQSSGNGGCTTSGALIGGAIIEASVQVVLDGSYGVYGSLPPPVPAFPGDAPGGAVAYQAVQIIFAD